MKMTKRALPEWFAPSINTQVIYPGVSSFGPQTPEVIAMLARLNSATTAELTQMGALWVRGMIQRRHWAGLDRHQDSTVLDAYDENLWREWSYAAHCARWMIGLYRSESALVPAGEAVQAVVLKHVLPLSRFTVLIAPWTETFGSATVD